MTSPRYYARSGKTLIFGLMLALLLAACDLNPTNPTPTPAASPTSAALNVLTQPAVAPPTAAANQPTANSGQSNNALPPIVATPMPRVTSSPGPALINVDKGIATKEMDVQTSRGLITIDLYPNAAPNTIAVYENMANSGLDDGRTFHRAEKWVLQGNDPKGDGTGGGDIPTELNKIHFKAGSVGIARTNDIQYSNDSQFFITRSTDPNGGQDFSFLDTVLDASGTPTGGYTLIGQVTSGMALVDAMQVGDKIISIRVTDKSGAAQTNPGTTTTVPNTTPNNPAAAPTGAISATVTPVNTPTSSQLTLAQMLLDTANQMKGISSFHLEEVSQSSAITYTLSGDVIISGSSTFTYNQGGQVFNLVTVGSNQYYSADSGKSWQASPSDLLANIKYYFTDIWTFIGGQKAASFASTAQDLGSESIAGQPTRHLRFDSQTLYGADSGANGALDFWIAADKTLRRMTTSGTSTSGAKVSVVFNWSNFNAVFHIVAPSNIVTPTPLAGATSVPSSTLTVANYDNVKSYHFTYTNVITSSAGVTATVSDVGDIVYPNKAHVINQTNASNGNSSAEYIIIGDDQYTRSSTVGWNRASGGTARYQGFTQLLTNQTSGLSALLTDMVTIGDENIAGEPCTHYRFIGGTSLGFNLDLWVAKSDQRPRQIHSVTTTSDVLITISNVNGVSDITAP